MTALPLPLTRESPISRPFPQIKTLAPPPLLTSLVQLLWAALLSLCVGPVKWKMAAPERDHFRESSSFEEA